MINVGFTKAILTSKIENLISFGGNTKTWEKISEIVCYSLVLDEGRRAEILEADENFVERNFRNLTDLMEVNREIVDKKVFRDYNKACTGAYWMGVKDLQEVVMGLVKNAARLKVIPKDDGVKVLLGSILGVPGKANFSSGDIIPDVLVRADGCCTRCRICSIM